MIGLRSDNKKYERNTAGKSAKTHPTLGSLGNQLPKKPADIFQHARQMASTLIKHWIFAIVPKFANVTKISSSKLILFVSERIYLNVFLFRFKSVQIVTGIYLHMLYFRCIWLLALKIANFVQNKMCTAVFNNICCKERKGLKIRQLSNSAIIFSQLQKTCGANIIWVFESTTSN